MNKSYNKTILIGRLKDDPIRIKHDDSSKDYLKFVILNSNSDQSVNTNNVFAFGKQADVCKKYLHKGDLCCIEGEIVKSELTGKQPKIVAEKVTFLSAKR